MVILHGSDFQVGRPYRRDVAQAFLDLSRALTPDLVVIAGDLTQRAKAAEYRVVRSFLDALVPAPVVVTPGNHDVPLYRFWERLVAPYANWRRFLGPELDTVTRIPGLTAVALNSSAPRRAIVGGRLDAPQVAFARDAFRHAAPGDARVLVVHHHFVPTVDGLGGRPLPGAAALLRAFEAMGVDLILGGHVHQTHVRTSRDLVPGDGAGIPLVACGTTASSRGRGPEAGLNTLNVIRLGGDAVEVVSHRFDRDRGGFVPGPARRLPVRAASRSAGVHGGGDA
ncbi:MAG TPA: metallophosphoesterase [Longimicrobiales bacterium]|nr:metallophosphoesterase [Longimicrobiales bacterium]